MSEVRNIAPGVGVRLKMIRMLCIPPISQAELAYLVGITYHHISKVETDKKGISLRVLSKISERVKADYKFLTEGVGDPFPNGRPKIVHDSDGKVAVDGLYEEYKTDDHQVDEGSDSDIKEFIKTIEEVASTNPDYFDWSGLSDNALLLIYVKLSKGKENLAGILRELSLEIEKRNIKEST